jgi:glycosyltransferase involved in cell wall biosynthesis
MASAVPVVSTNVGGPAETIVDGETGFLVPPNRPDLLAERVVHLLERDELRRRMGDAGRDRVLRLYSVRRYAEAMTSLFERAR